MRACSTSIATPTTTGPSTRSSATRSNSSQRCSPASRAPASGSTCAATQGAHPRIGAADVVPLVPIHEADAERARAAALELARRVGEELALPVFLYADLAPGRGPAFFRRGGPAELQRRIDAGELAPDFGPAQLDERRAA